MLSRIMLALPLLFLGVAVHAQNKTPYEGLVDRLFHVPDSREGIYILRFSHSVFEPEMQVVFSLPFDGRCSASVWFLPKGEPSLLAQWTQRFLAAPSSPEEVLANGLVALQRDVEVPCDGATAARMRAVRTLSVRIPRDYGVAVDGIQFQLEVRMGATQLTSRWAASTLDESYEEPVIDWMALVGRSFRDAVRR